MISFPFRLLSVEFDVPITPPFAPLNVKITITFVTIPACSQLLEYFLRIFVIVVPREGISSKMRM